MSECPISGHVAPGFEPVGEAFAVNFAEDQELGAGFCAILNGETVVDLHGGWADKRKTTLWDASTIVPVYSATKGISALVLARVIDQLPAGYKTLVAEVWPEFAAAGKEAVTIAEMVSHQAGLSGFAEEIDPALWLDPPACAAALAAQKPIWPPGSAHGYHPLSWGYLIGELVQRIAGRSLGTILREDIAGPAGIDFQIGTPDTDLARIGEMMRPRALPELGEINAATRAAFLTKWASAKRGDAAWRTIEIPSANGHGGASGVAALYGIYANGGRLGSAQIVPEASFEALITPRTIGQDLVLPFVVEFTSGLMRNNLGFFGPNPNTLCHAGWGGSMGLGDPDEGLSAAYVMNRQSNSLIGDPRARRLADALYACL